MAKDFGYQFMLLAEKMGDGNKTFANLVKSNWKSIGLNKNIIASIIANFRPNILANKENNENCVNTLELLEKNWDKTYYKQFYQIDEVISSDKFFQRVSTIVQQY